MKRCYLFFALFLGMISFALGQEIKGGVGAKVGGSPMPLQNVRVQLLDGEKILLEGLSSKSGTFSLKGAPLGEQPLLLQLSLEGYDPKYITLKPIAGTMDLGAIFLEKSATELATVEISASRQLKRSDSFYAFPSLEEKKHATEAYDLLHRMMLPSIEVNPITNTVQTSSGEAVLILLNEREASRVALKTLNPALITRIEYIDSPGVEYGQGQYGAVLKITALPPYSGFAVGLDLTNGLTSLYGEHYTYLKYNYKRSEWGLAYEPKYERVRKRKIDEIDHYLLADGDKLEVDRAGLNRPLAYTSHGLVLSYNYTEPKRNIFNLELSGTLYDSPDRGHAQMISVNKEKTYLSETKPREKNRFYTLDAFYQHTFRGGDVLKANLHGTLISTDYGYQFIEQPPMGERRQGYETDGLKRSVIGELRYQHALSPKHQLVLGSRYKLGHTRNVYKTGQEHTTEIRDEDLYLYGALEGRWQTLRYSLGVGASRTFFKQAERSLSRWLVRPMLTMMLPLKGWRLQYEGSLMPTMPSLAQLSDVAVQSNLWELSRGNPSLKMYATISNRLRAQRNFFGKLMTVFTLGSRYSIDPIGTVVSREGAAQQPLYVTGYQNMGHQHQLYGSLEFKLQAIPKLLTLAGRFAYNHYDSQGLGYRHKLGHFSAMGQVQLTMGSWLIDGRYKSSTESLLGEQITKKMPSLNLILGYRWGNWGFGLMAENLFSPSGLLMEERLVNELHQSSQKLYVGSKANFVGLNVSWRFFSGRDYEAGATSLSNSDDDTGILKF